LSPQPSRRRNLQRKNLIVNLASTSIDAIDRPWLARKIARSRKIRLLGGRVEERRGDLGRAATLRFLSPLIKPDVPISGIRLSD